MKGLTGFFIDHASESFIDHVSEPLQYTLTIFFLSKQWSCLIIILILQKIFVRMIDLAAKTLRINKDVSEIFINEGTIPRPNRVKGSKAWIGGMLLHLS